MAASTKPDAASAPGPSAPVIAGGRDSDLQRKAKRHLWMHFTRMGAYADAEVPIIARGEGWAPRQQALRRAVGRWVEEG